MSILDKVNSSEDLKKLSYEELRVLSDEIRQFIINNVSLTGGHLASNLGVVELSLALNRVYNPNVDRIVYDVGHQCYTHKIINGRKNEFNTLRQLNGISGFPKPCESEADSFISGHSSTSISVAFGMSKARTINNENYYICAVIGDGALTGGLAYEGLENVAASKEPILIILNDNAMSINNNVGGMDNLLQKIRSNPDYLKFKRKFRAIFKQESRFYLGAHKAKELLKKKLLKGNMFSDMGFEYLGPIDGHDVEILEKVIRWAKDIKKPVLLHVITVKGKGCKYAAEQPDKYHGIGPFNAETGEPISASEGFGDKMGKYLCKLAKDDRRIVAVTAAMSNGTGLEEFKNVFPDRFFDVGIAEQHAVAMCAGMAKQGLIPIFAVYSSFLQRSYDMLIHDISLQNLHVIFGVDRSGIVGNDGETHNGVFDVAYLSSVPGMSILCPASFKEHEDMLKVAIYDYDGPVAIRYPRGTEGLYVDSILETEKVIKSGSDVTLVCYGIMTNQILEAEKILSKEGVSCEVVKLGAIKPCDFSVTLNSISKTKKFVIAEDVCKESCVGVHILSSAINKDVYIESYRLLNLNDGIATHGKVNEIYKKYGLDSDSIVNAVKQIL